MRHVPLRFSSSLIVGIGLLLVGCGGSGGSSGSANSPFAGNYRIDVATNRAADAVLLVVVDGAGKADLALSDGSGVLYSGSGTLNASGHAVVAATSGSGGAATSFSLDFVAGTSKSMSGSATGGIAIAAFSAPRATSSPFAGAYDATYDGDASGTATVNISDAGKVTGTVVDSGTSLAISGSLQGAGTLSFTAKGSVSGSSDTITWTGKFYLTPTSAAGAGTWRNATADADGTWDVTKVEN